MVKLWRRPVVWAAAVLLLSGAGGGAWALGLLPGPGAGACGGSALRITIAAQPEIAPALRGVAERFNVEEHRVAGRCVDARIKPVSPGGYLGDATLRARTDAWVPESTLWLATAREAGNTSVPAGGTPVAATPVVLATPRPVEAELRDAEVGFGWELLLKGKAGGVPLARYAADPAAGMSGTIAMLAIEQVAEGKAGDAAEALRENAPRRPDESSGGSMTVLADFIGAERFARPLAVTTEQAVVAYNDGHRPNPIVRLMPDEGTLMLDHPYVVTTEDQDRRDAAEAFKAALATRPAHDVLHRAGFRAADGTLPAMYADQHGFTEEPPPSLRLPTREEINEARASWET